MHMMKSVWYYATACLLFASRTAFGFCPSLQRSTRSTRLQASPNPLIATAAQGMTLLAPLFQAEAALQANILASDDVRAQAQQDLEQAKRQHKVLIYTYGLSPFSTEAVALLEASGYPYTKMELGLEWFLLGGYGSALRQALGAQVPNGATSLPKIFIGGQCVGGCAELASLVESGELDTLMKQAKVKKSS